jgi:hypothetical protein
MEQWLPLGEAAEQLNVTERGLRYRVSKGTIESKLEDGKRDVLLNSEAKLHGNAAGDIQATFQALLDEKDERIKDWHKILDDKDKQIDSLNHLLQDASEAQQRSDTIILQLTRQFDEQTKLLEDLRHKQDTKWYQRFFRR